MMKYQVPTNLIDQIQISLREEALLDSFNPLDSSLPLPPTVEEAIASIDLSCNHLHCKLCRGSLLRGLQSVICIYCGHDQQQEPPPQPISFKSTLGFGCLLQSLGLDASEIVGLPIDRAQYDKGQHSRKDEISLSDLLDLDLKWPDAFNRHSVKIAALFPRKGFLNLVGEDFDSRFDEESREHASRISSELPASREKMGNKETTKFREEGNFALFENTESNVAVLRSDNGEHDESSAWEAEFQSASRDTEYEHSQSSNVSILPPSEFQSASRDESAELSSIPFAPRSNLTKSNPTLSSGSPFDSKLSEGNILVKDVEFFAAVNTSSSFAWPPEDVQKKTTADPPDDKMGVGDEAIDEWGDFETVGGSENNKCEPFRSDMSGGLDMSSDSWNDFTGSVGGAHSQFQTNAFKVSNDDSLSMWRYLASKSKTEDIQLDPRSIDMNQPAKHHGIDDPMLGRNNFDFSTHISSVIQDDQLHDTGAKPAASNAGDSFDFWNDFESHTVERQETRNVEADDKILSSVGNSTIDSWNDLASFGASKVRDISSADDSFVPATDNFGSWNNFTGSTGVFDDKPIGDDHLTQTFADQHQSGATQSASEHTTFEDDGLFDSWSDFRSSETQVGNVTVSSSDQISVKEAPESQTVLMNDRIVDSWGDFGSSTSIFGMQSQVAGAEFCDEKSTGLDTDFFDEWSDSGIISANPLNNQVNSNGVTENEGKLPSVSNYAFDSWSDFASSINVGANSSVSSPANASDHKEAAKHDDPFDSWNVFVSSPDVQTHHESAVVNECAPESDLFRTTANVQGVDHIQAHAFLAPEVPDLLRMENGDVKAEKHAELMNQSETTMKNSDPSTSDVETLISEMHDLSFMLESTLSIPKSSK